MRQLSWWKRPHGKAPQRRVVFVVVAETGELHQVMACALFNAAPALIAMARENVKLREALTFYADKRNHQIVVFEGAESSELDMTRIELDLGNMTRAALAHDANAKAGG